MSTATTASRLAAELRAICGAEHVVEDPAELHRDQIARERLPRRLSCPGSADEIAAILRFANEHGLSVVPAGGFTQQQTGNCHRRWMSCCYTSRLTEVEHYDPGDLTIGIGAGCTVAQLCDRWWRADKLLLRRRSASAGARARLVARWRRDCTVRMRHGYGGLRDYCIGVRFVTGDGRKAKGGGRVVKNVAGYDMMKLLIGSQGTLGIITSASFKLFPAPRQTRTFVAEFASAAKRRLGFAIGVLRSPLDRQCAWNWFPPMPRGCRSGRRRADAWLVLRACERAAMPYWRAIAQNLGQGWSREVEGAERTRVSGRRLSDFPLAA